METEKNTLEQSVENYKEAYTSYLVGFKETEAKYQQKQTELKDMKIDYSKNLSLKQETESEWIRLKNQVEHLENFIENKKERRS